MNSLVLSDIKTGFENKDFYVVAQPKIDLKTRNIVGFEILSRLEINQKPVPPSIFIEAIKDQGVLKDFTNQVIIEAIEFAEIIDNLVDRDMKISVNITPEELMDEDYIDNIVNVISKNKAKRAAIMLEVTEGDLLGVRHTKSLKKLHSRGIELSIDDFWTGYSCMQSLQTGYFSEIKIDHTITSKIVNDHVAMAGLQSIVEMATNLNLRCVIEGIETNLVRDIALDAGGEFGQGFLFSSGIKKEDIYNWTKTWMESENSKDNLQSIPIFLQSEMDLLSERNHPTWAWSFDGFKITWGNKHAINFWGCESVSDLTSKDYSSISYKTSRRLSSYKKRFLGGEAQISSSWIFYPNDIPKSIYCVCVPRIERATGNLIMLVIALDGYSKKQKKTRFLESYEDIPIPYILVDKSGKILKVNDIAFSDLGIESESIIDYVNKEYFDLITSEADKVESFECYVSLSVKDGEVHAYAKILSHNKVSNDGAEYGLIFIPLPCFNGGYSKPKCIHLNYIES